MLFKIHSIGLVAIASQLLGNAFATAISTDHGHVRGAGFKGELEEDAQITTMEKVRLNKLFAIFYALHVRCQTLNSVLSFVLTLKEYVKQLPELVAANDGECDGASTEHILSSSKEGGGGGGGGGGDCTSVEIVSFMM